MMGSNRLKKVILATLLLTLVYVWGSNLSLFTSSESSMTGTIYPDKSGAVRSSTTNSLDYMPARINPFKKPGSPNPTPIAKKEKAKTAQPPPSRPGSLYKLTGFVDRKPYSQIVLNDKDGRSVIIGLGDSLGVWQLMSIASDIAVFSSGKFSDTLYLAE